MSALNRPFAAALVAALLLVPSVAQAQLGGITKRVKLPGKEKVEAPAAAVGVPSGPELDEESLDALLAGLKAEKAEQDKVAEAAKARIAKAEAARQNAGPAYMNALMRHQECVSQAGDKDPRAAQVRRLRDASSDEDDEAKADRLDAKADSVQALIDAKAEKGCEKLKPNMEEMAASANEHATLPSESQAIRDAKPQTEAAGAKAGGMDAKEYAAVKERVINVLYAPARFPLTSDERKAFTPRRDALQSALKAVQ